MPMYAYEAFDNAGVPVHGKLEAEHEQVAIGRLRKMGYTVVDMAEVTESPLKKVLSGQRKVKIRDITFFSRQLAAMISAGIPLTRCLYTLREQSTNPALRSIVGEIARNVEGGMSLSESLRAYPNVFSPMFVDMIRAGEVGGAMEEMLKRLADQLERNKTLRDNIRAATFYPTVVVLFAFFVVLAMLLFVVPIFIGFFPPGTSLPLPTLIVMAMSNSLRAYWYIHILLFIAAVLGLRFYLASEAGKNMWERVKFRLPVFGDLLKKAAVANFSRTLSTLLAGGIPVLQALETAGPATGSRQITKAVQQTGVGLQEGRGIAMLLAKSGFFPPMLVNMVAIGEETGELSGLLGKVADFYEEEVATTTKGLTSLLEPVLLIVVGTIIGGMVIAIYLPIFTAITSTGF
ncbi:type II secretion system F family protein [Desulfallas thermosapovorans]|uniref:Type IV pilus assembly protein PilC n=1 Tax=Desulfallas thermosapovorans DSM 6562 TaxID=1121431 RepID=A0A5S4ZR16_9FIRM|nr:type II secretion system F family protein [Desulfallas thermosapovorans]TYO95063.1 type IV pilus assembly protein PilC [Desulfallas thermosapovorans DSM 6562]